MEKAKTAAGVVIVLVSALGATPLIARNLSPELLTIATITVLAHSLFGILDLFRPLIVRRIAIEESFATYFNLLIPSLSIGSLFILLMNLLVFSFTDSFHSHLSISVSISAFIFCIYAPFWATLEGHLRMGTAYLIRAISVASLYALIVTGAVLRIHFLVIYGIVVANFFALFGFWHSAKSHIGRGGMTVNKEYFKSSAYIFTQNIFKICNDFGDRIAASALLPVSIIGGYNLVSDFSARTTFPAQIAASYYYPVLCRDRRRASNFLLGGAFLSLFLAVFSVFFYFFGKSAFDWYFGSNIGKHFAVFCGLLASFALYTLAFFGQSIFRSLSRDRELSALFAMSFTLGIAALAVSVNDISIYTVLLSAFAFKMSGALITARLIRLFPLGASIGLFSAAISGIFVLYICFYR